MRKRIAKPAFVACALATTMASVVPAAGASAPRFNPGPSGVSITIATVNGSGCPSATAAVALSPSRDAFTITHRDYVAQVGGGSKAADSHKNCQINLKVHVPQGFTYRVSSVDHQLYASLQRGAEAIFRSSYYFQGSSNAKEFTHRLPGPYDGIWQFTDTDTEPTWKPCGEERNFNVKTELQVNEGTSDPTKVSLAAASATDNSIKTTYHLDWKTCP
ncbi:DUF4360 domain-containing protein [Actinomadura roseirufa]|uniref:DUF4360 domain-containing protein n=1 Tax=Actinomadura roseirufa TaxID=2094049 RepID=UPI001041A7F4|nr:DUF4360 domain-containing protein [Actinomadura roseirufa]